MQGLFVQQINVGGYDDNFSYLIYDPETRACLIVDPCGSFGRVVSEIEGQVLTVVGIALTHTHFDHVERLAEAREKYTVPVYVHKNGIKRINVPEPIAVDDTTPIILGAHDITVMHTPGHIDDSVCYYIPREHAYLGTPKLISGDTLFVEGCGRTTSEHVEELYDSLQRLKELPDATEVFPGHDYGSKPSSTIRQEKEGNKYMLAYDKESFTALRLPNK